MKTYMITYDLYKPIQNYNELYDGIKQIGDGWLHPLNNIWLVVSAMNASAIRDRLTAHIDSNDKLLVMELGPDWASLNLGKPANDWLKDCGPYLTA